MILIIYSVAIKHVSRVLTIETSSDITELTLLHQRTSFDPTFFYYFQQSPDLLPCAKAQWQKTLKERRCKFIRLNKE